MKKQLSGITALLFVIAISACAQTKSTTKTTATTTKTTKTKVAKNAPAISYLAMNRTACFGKCPAYKVEVYSDGLVRYSSQMFTEYEGVYEKNVGAAKAQAVLSLYSKNRVDTCQGDYKNIIPDIPGLVYEFKYGKTTKKIYNAHFGPEFLQTNAGKVDEIAKVDNTWKKVADQKKP
jgi:hypothetical protein